MKTLKESLSEIEYIYFQTVKGKTILKSEWHELGKLTADEIRANKPDGCAKIYFNDNKFRLITYI